MSSKFKYVFLLLIVLLMSFDSSKGFIEKESEEPVLNELSDIKLVNAFPNLTFERPVDLQMPKGSSNQIYVVEQKGIIWSFNNDSEVTKKKSFLDIQSIVDNKGNEEGLLGLAFHPEFESNGYFFVNYTTERSTTVIARFQSSSANSNTANIASKVNLLEFDQPYGNHNGGQLAFGPDGYLYIAVGDGGSAGDPKKNGQNLDTLLGSILRIDVDQTSENLNYAIPSENPFADHPTHRKEIFAYGLRNPWRMSFDALDGTMWAGDVGQNKYEEIDIIENGKNYGWNIMEGNHCYKSDSCDETGLTNPVFDYNHKENNVSITGGHMYRGGLINELKGFYVYADFVSGRIWTLSTSDYTSKLLMDTTFNISSFGVDLQNEMYICAFDGNIYKFSN